MFPLGSGPTRFVRGAAAEWGYDRSVPANAWRDLEVLCPVYEAWHPSGGAMTAANFQSDHEAITGTGTFALSCGHEVDASRYNVRLGGRIGDAAMTPS